MNESVCWQFRQGSSEMARLWPTWCWLGSFPCLQSVGRSAWRGLSQTVSLAPCVLFDWNTWVYWASLSMKCLIPSEASLILFTCSQCSKKARVKAIRLPEVQAWKSFLLLSCSQGWSEDQPVGCPSKTVWPAAILCNIIALGPRARFLTFWTSISSSFKM